MVIGLIFMLMRLKIMYKYWCMYMYVKILDDFFKKG